jgi:hypothetical protein
MVKFKIKANPSGQFYFPKVVRQELGTNLTVLCNAEAAVIFPENIPFEVIAESVELILRDLRHRQQIQVG